MEGICRSCGLPLAAGDIFCGNCGQATAVPAKAATAAPPARSAAVPPRTPATGRTNFSWPSSPSTPVPAEAAVGQQTPNALYLGLRLVYDKSPEPSFDPIRNGNLLRQFALHWLLYLVVYSVGGLLAGIVLLILAVIGIGLSAAITLWLVGAAIIALLLGCLYWLIPVPAQLSEWKFLVDGKAQVAPVTFDHIAWALQQRQTPLDMVQVRRLKLAGGEGRDYLELRRGLFSGLICCFAYGADLYVGWTFWLRISPLRWFLMLIARLWQTLMRRGTDLYVSLRYDYARAMREAMHSVAREGVDVAVGAAHPQGQNIGQSLQVAVADFDI
jgi:hypothetical protein